MHEKYDVVVIGGGVSGCYAAYRLLQLHPHLRVAVVEAGTRLGGRATTEVFEKVSVVTGAGVGRLHKDRLLFKLVHQLALPFAVFETAHHINSCAALPVKDAGVESVERDFTKLKALYERRRVIPSMTFKDFAKSLLGPVNYNAFVSKAGYSDFENADAADVLHHYGFDDNYTSWVAFTVPWSALIAAMVVDIPCLLQTRVTRLSRLPDGMLGVHTSSSQILHVRRVIIATNASGLRFLLPAHRKLYAHIRSQPFLRVYGAFDPASALILAGAICPKGVTVLVDSPLQKVLHIKDNVYMVAYCDNANATYLQRHASNKAFLCTLLENGLKLQAGTLRMLAVRAYYWKAGTHYFDPLHRPFLNRQAFLTQAQHPEPGVFVAGECVALHQGWVEGALETVENVLERYFKL